MLVYLGLAKRDIIRQQIILLLKGSGTTDG